MTGAETAAAIGLLGGFGEGIGQAASTMGTALADRDWETALIE
jgi:hypothetical protein